MALEWQSENKEAHRYADELADVFRESNWQVVIEAGDYLSPIFGVTAYANVQDDTASVLIGIMNSYAVDIELDRDENVKANTLKIIVGQKQDF